MKKVLVLGTLVMAIAAQAQASCDKAALWAAVDAYGSFIHRTHTRVIEPEKVYVVTVGIGNEEDGPHTYRVTFKNDKCDPKQAQVCDLTQPGYGPSADCGM